MSDDKAALRREESFAVPFQRKGNVEKQGEFSFYGFL